MANHANIADLFDDIAVKIQDKTGNHDDTIIADNFPAAIENIAIPLILTPRDITVQTSASTTATYASNDNIRIRDNEGNDHTLAEWNRLFADAGFDKDNMSVQPIGIRVQAADVDEVYLFDRYTGVTYNPSGQTAAAAGKLQHSLFNYSLVAAAGSGTDSTTNKGWSVVADGDNYILNEDNTGQFWTIAKNTGTCIRHQAFNIRERVQSLWAQTEWMRHRMAIDSGLTTSESDGTMAPVQILNSSGAQAAVGEDMYFWIGGTNTNKLAKYNLNNKHNVSGYYLTQAIADAIYAAQIAQGVNMNDTGVNSTSKPVLAPGSKGAEAIAVGGKWYIITPYISNPNATTTGINNNLADSPAIYWAIDKGYAMPSDGLLDAMYFNETLCTEIINYFNSVESRGLPIIPHNDYIWSAFRSSDSYGWFMYPVQGSIHYSTTHARNYHIPALPSTPQPAIEEEFISKTAQHSGPAQLLKVYGKSIIWRQSFKNYSSAYTSNGVTITPDADGYLTFSGTASAEITLYWNGSSGTPPAGGLLTNGHKVFIGLSVAGGSLAGSAVMNITASSGGGSHSIGTAANFIVSVAASGNSYPRILIASGTAFSSLKIRIVNIDLTDIYGAGNEPASVAAFLADYPTFNPAYDAGSLQSNKTSLLRAERIPVINVWDEEWENGTFNTTTGVNIDHSAVLNQIRAKNLIPIIGGRAYYFRSPSLTTGGQGLWCMLYDAANNIINAGNLASQGRDGNSFLVRNKEVTLPSNAAYLRFYITNVYGATYLNDICINLSDPAINGQYYPHWRGKLTLNLSTLTGKLNGEGASVAVFPDGLRGVGTDRDAAYGSTGEVRWAKVKFSDLTGWRMIQGEDGAYNTFDAFYQPLTTDSNLKLICDNYVYSGEKIMTTHETKLKALYHRRQIAGFFVVDTYTSVAEFLAAQGDTEMCYELATPLTYTLDTPLPTDFDVRAGDKMIAESDNNCPFVGDIVYKV